MGSCKITIFGAGATGLAHLGLLLSQCGERDICYIEKRSEVADALAQRGAFRVRLLSLYGEPERLITVDCVGALRAGEREACARRVSESDLVLTSVIAENLPDVCETVVIALKMRMESGVAEPLHIVCCENLDHASSLLKRLVYEKLDPAARAWADERVAFPDCMISRVAPVPTADPLELVTEDYNEWATDASAYKGGFAPPSCVEVVPNLDARLERKLWIHNGGHATLAYLAWQGGFKYVHEALADKKIADFTVQVLDELGDCVRDKYPEFTLKAIRQYERDLGMRGALAEMRDDISRVVRDPLRKLGERDRLLAPAIYASEHSLPCDGICRSIINVTRYDDPRDAQSVKMRAEIAERGFDYFIRQTVLHGAHPELANKLIRINGEE